MLVQQIQMTGDTSSANELGLTVVGETEAADFVLSSKKAERNREKSSCETRKYKTGSAYQVLGSQLLFLCCKPPGAPG